MQDLHKPVLNKIKTIYEESVKYSFVAPLTLSTWSWKFDWMLSELEKFKSCFLLRRVTFVNKVIYQLLSQAHVQTKIWSLEEPMKLLMVLLELQNQIYYHFLLYRILTLHLGRVLSFYCLARNIIV